VCPPLSPRGGRQPKGCIPLTPIHFPTVSALSKQGRPRLVHTRKMINIIILISEFGGARPLSRDLAGQGIFCDSRLKKTTIKPPRGRPFGGGGVHRSWGNGGISPHFCIYSIHTLPIQNGDEPFFDFTQFTGEPAQVFRVPAWQLPVLPAAYFPRFPLPEEHS